MAVNPDPDIPLETMNRRTLIGIWALLLILGVGALISTSQVMFIDKLAYLRLIKDMDVSPYQCASTPSICGDPKDTRWDLTTNGDGLYVESLERDDPLLINLNDSRDLATLGQGLVFWNEGQKDLAAEIWGNAPQISNYFMMLARQENSSEKRIPLYQKAIAANPESSLAHYLLARDLASLELDSDALLNLHRAEELESKDPNPSLMAAILLIQADIYRRLDKYDLARDRYERIDDDSSQSSRAMIGLAKLDMLEDDPDRAIRRLQWSISRFPDDPRLNYALANIYDRNGQVEKATATLEELTRKWPDNDLAWQYLGNLAVRAGDCAKGKEAYSEYLLRNPENATVQKIYNSLECEP